MKRARTQRPAPEAAATPTAGRRRSVNPAWSGLAYGVQRKCDACDEGDKTVQRKVDPGSISDATAPVEEGLDPPAVQFEVELDTPGDAFEQEADAVADAVVKGEAVPEVSPDEAGSGRAFSDGGAQRTLNVALSSKGAGQPVAPAIQRQVEPALGADLSGVRVHRGEAADTAARQLNARAFTHQRDIWLRSDQSPTDTRLMAHELTHTVQQGAVPGAPRRQRAPSVQRDPDPPSHSVAERKAQEVYEALDGYNEEERALNALKGHGAPMRALIARKFRQRYNKTLKTWLKDQLGGDDLVKAFALLQASHWHELHTAMGLALIPNGTRDEEVVRILTAVGVPQKSMFERAYNNAFRSIGKGSLKADLKDDLSGNAERKALGLLHRRLTEADHLYFEADDDHNESVMRRLQRVWGSGYDAFHAMNADWDRYVRNRSGWSYEAWTDHSMYEELDDEMSGQEWAVAQAILHGYLRQKHQGDSRFQHIYLEEQSADQIALQVAENVLTGASEGGGTEEDPIFWAVSQIRTIYQRRIRQAPEGPQREEAERAWATRRRNLLAFLPSEMDTGTADHARARLLLYGNLTPADEVWLAKQAYDNDKILQLVTGYWADGRIPVLRRGAEMERRHGETVIRPSYRLYLTISATRGRDFSRMYIMQDDRYNDVRNGSRRIALELNEGDSDSDLEKAYKVLTWPGIRSGLALRVINYYARAHLGHIRGETGIAKFLKYIDDRYERSIHTWRFRDLLSPSTDPAELHRRAQGAWDASNTGFWNGVGNFFVGAYDMVTGEDSLDVVDESLDRLNFIATAQPDELAVMMVLAGVTDAQQLATWEYRLFQQRLDEVRAIKRAVTEAIAAVVEVVVGAVVTAMTGGAGAGLLISALASTTAGIVTRELLLGQDYDAISAQNAQALLMAGASVGFGAMGRSMFSSWISPQRLEELGRAGRFLEGAFTEGYTAANVQLLALGMQGRVPTAEDLLGATVNVLGSSLAGGTGSALTNRLPDGATIFQQMQNTARGKIAENLISGVSDTAQELITSGTGDLSVGDIAARFGRNGAMSFMRGVIESAGEVAAQRPRRRGRPATEQGSEGEAADTGPLMRQIERDFDRLQRGHVVAAEGQTGPGPVAAVTVGRHVVTVVRRADGSVIVTVCNTCGHLRDRLLVARERGVDEGLISRIQGEVAAIERAHGDEPTAPSAVDRLRRAAQLIELALEQHGELSFEHPSELSAAMGRHNAMDVARPDEHEGMPIHDGPPPGMTGARSRPTETQLPAGSSTDVVFDHLRAEFSQFRALLDGLQSAGVTTDATQRAMLRALVGGDTLQEATNTASLRRRLRHANQALLVMSGLQDFDSFRQALRQLPGGEKGVLFEIWYQTRHAPAGEEQVAIDSGDLSTQQGITLEGDRRPDLVVPSSQPVPRALRQALQGVPGVDPATVRFADLHELKSGSQLNDHDIHQIGDFLQMAAHTPPAVLPTGHVVRDVVLSAMEPALLRNGQDTLGAWFDDNPGRFVVEVANADGTLQRLTSRAQLDAFVALNP